jgi:hypothetical protein
MLTSFNHALQQLQIPVWDRQPQWNMVVTNKEQEKELKAYTCKNCGSTLFIARNRDWFFEGDTGLGGLGCYTCGAKGKDNFVMDRDRILEDVGDDDDYFDYERPLDFVTAAERRALLKKAKGDEDAANQMLVDQANAASKSNAPEGAVDAVIEKTADETKKEEEATESTESGDVSSSGGKDPAEVDTTGDSSAEVKPKKKKKRRRRKRRSPLLRHQVTRKKVSRLLVNHQMRKTHQRRRKSQRRHPSRPNQ